MHMEQKLAALETENKNLKAQITRLKQVNHDAEQILDFLRRYTQKRPAD
mgnify:CR=1 FL=1